MGPPRLICKLQARQLSWLSYPLLWPFTISNGGQFDYRGAVKKHLCCGYPKQWLEGFLQFRVPWDFDEKPKDPYLPILQVFLLTVTEFCPMMIYANRLLF